DRAATDRSNDKDALDVLRLLRCVPVGGLAVTVRSLLKEEISGTVTREALSYLADLFSNVRGRGAAMAAQAAAPLEDPETITSSCVALARDLLGAISAAKLEAP